MFRLIQSAWPDVGDPVITKEGVGIALTDLAPPHFCVCPKTGPGFQTSDVVVFLCVK